MCFIISAAVIDGSMIFPFSSMNKILSISESNAAPKSAFVFLTFAWRSLTFLYIMGFGMWWGKVPLGVNSRPIIFTGRFL